MSAVLSKLRSHLRRQLETENKSQMQIAKEAGVSQSTISRVINGRKKRVSNTVKRLCNYANIDLAEFKADPRKNEELMAAIGQAWKGTEADAKTLAALVRRIAAIREP